MAVNCPNISNMTSRNARDWCVNEFESSNLHFTTSGLQVSIKIVK
jgi:hypothetical protein